MYGRLGLSHDDALLRLLPGREKWTLSTEAIRSGAALDHSDLAAHLVSKGLVTRQALIACLSEIKGVHACAAEGEVMEARIARVVPLASALAADIWPLATVGQRLYVLSDQDSPIAEEELTVGDGPPFQVFSLGRLPDLKSKVLAAQAVLGRLDPGRRTLPEYLRSLGLLREPAAPSHHGLGHDGEKKHVEEAASEAELALARAAYSDLPFIDQARIEDLLDLDVLHQARAGVALPRSFLPLRVEQDALWVVSDHVPDPTLLDELTSKLKCAHTRILASTRTAIAGAAEMVSEPTPIPSSGTADAVVPAITDRLLLEGVHLRCSDIHIERYRDRVDVRLRKDGVLFLYADSGVVQDNVQNVVARLKVIARLDIAETRRPQDGVIRQQFGERTVDFRVATQPTVWGENMVLRILDQSTPPRLDGLGFDDTQLARLRRVVANPQGLLLVTGPTGSGKTTTLYAILQEVKSPEIKILTAEDPVEYAIDGIQQSAVNEAIGDTFARYIRAFLRQDPDVILVGEIRDEETAEAAIRAALTGHLVLSTVHANDVFGVVRRLMDLGVDPSVLSQTLEGIIGQRLARKVCRECAAPYVPPPELIREFYPRGVPEGATFLKGRGCPHCRRTGYSGRIALIEFWVPDAAARDLMDTAGRPAALRQAAEEAAFEPLIVNAIRQAGAGITTLEELRSIVPYEYVARHIQQGGQPAPPAPVVPSAAEFEVTEEADGPPHLNS